MTEFEFAKISTIIIIESLPEGDRKTGQELYDDTVKRYIEYHGRDEIIHEFYVVNDKTQFLELMMSICSKIESYPKGVLIHLEAHGSSDQSGIVFADGSETKWNEMQHAFISINVALNNQLFISMATCFGRFLYKTIDINRKAPFRAFISASNEVFPDEIIEDYGAVFEELISKGDLIKAYLAANAKGIRYYYKDARTVAAESFYSFEAKMKEPAFKSNFLANSKANWQLLKERNNLPEFEEMDFQSIFEMVKLEYMIKITENFFFDSFKKEH